MVTLSWDSLKLTLHSTYSYWQIICWNKTPISTMSKFLITKRLGGSLVLVPRLPSTSPLSPSSSWRNAIQLCDIVSTRYSAPCPQASARKEQKKRNKKKIIQVPKRTYNTSPEPGIFDGPQSPRGEHDTSGDFVKSFGQ